MTDLVLRSLSKTFGQARAVRDVDLTVQSGEFLSLLGPSGCGKTTLLRLIAGLETPDAGAILIDGRDMATVPPQARKVGMVFQSYALFPHMRVWQNVAFGLSVQGLPATEQNARVDAILETVQLFDLADRFPAQLSGGQRQRVALARTLVTRPSVLMLDEPLANLDTGLRAEMRRFIRGLQRQFGLTTILVTHDQSEALEMSDRVAVMLDGAIVQDDAPEAVYRRPVRADVARFLGVENLFPARIDGQVAQTPIGPLPVAAGSRQGSALVTVRAESLSFQDEGELVGRVASREFTGPVVRYRLAIGEDHLVVTHPAHALLDPGTRVRLSIQAEDVWVLPPEAAPSRGRKR